MFFGAVPTDCIQQVFKIMDIDAWSDVHVCCSGSFRLERAISSTYKDIRIHSNDVSVYSAAIGGLATGKPIEVQFVDRLAFVEDLLVGASDERKVAAVLVGCEMSRYARSNNKFNVRHFEHYAKNFDVFLTATTDRVHKAVDTMRIENYFGGDWRKHCDDAIEKKSGILAFPPFFMGDYEAQFKFIESSLKWDAPQYDLYNPSQLRDIARGLEERGATYCILTDQIWDDKKPVLKYQTGRKVPHYCYANTPKSSWRQKGTKAVPFRYDAVDVDKLTKKTKVDIVVADSNKLNFIKDVYLGTNIIHSSGFGNYLIYLDGKLAGAVIYDESPTTRAAYGPRTLYLLSDVTVTTKGKLSKLVAMIAQSRILTKPLETRMLKRYDKIVTTARSKNPSSMKYRGIFKMLSRREDLDEGGFVIQYGADLIEETPQQIYRTWWNKYGPNAGQAGNGNQKASSPSVKAPRGQRKVYDGGPATKADV